jgi:uncharacterized membrane protein YraQ (UPF0718 family)
MSALEWALLILCILGGLGMAVAWGIVVWEQLRWDWRTRDAPWNQKNWKR